jgi:membrane fusion protein (multidrug efflux system)
MKKRIILTISGLLVLVAIIAGVKFLQIRKMMEQGANFVPPPETVTTAVVAMQTWEALLTAVGSLTAVQGVTVAAEQPGKVVRIAFEPGAAVPAGALLVELDTSTERAQLPGAEAQVALAKNNLERSERLLAERIISPAEHDAAVANYRQARAEAGSIRAEMGKKAVRAPFAGRLGIRLVNLGQMLKEGDPIVSLQSLDPIFVDFLLPQQQLGQLRLGLPVRVTTDALPGEIVEGRITAINPEVDAATRNIRVQATAANPQERLRPGMFVNVAVVLPAPTPVFAIPATAVLYAPYSDSVFVVEAKKDEKTGESGKVIRQQVVRLGEKRGDFIAVTEGLKEGETVVSTGVFKLRNGQAVVVDNKLAPEFKLAPVPENQ